MTQKKVTDVIRAMIEAKINYHQAEVPYYLLCNIFIEVSVKEMKQEATAVRTNRQHLYGIG